MNDFDKILKAIEKGGIYKLSNNCDVYTYDYSEWSDSKEIMIYLNDYESTYLEFDKDGNLIKIY